ncbi:DUF2877 domain-containing protein [Bacillus sp. MM2020_1]|nr:DUF2877 domain-containing protein [Bacillus sp. MM2020_1]
MIQALSGDVEFVQAIVHSGFNGFIHSIFDKTVNIKCRKTGDLYTLASNSLDNGPNSIVIDINSFADSHFELTDNVFTNKNTLYIEDKMAISLNDIKKWECLLPGYPINDTRLRKNLIIIKNQIEEFGKSGGMKRNSHAKNPFEIEMANMLQERAHSLLCSLVNNNVADALRHANGLIGLGPGLTPSGDDFLTGLMATFHLPNCPCLSFRSFNENVVTSAQSLTNDISYMTLKMASVARVRESIVTLLHLALNGEEEHLISALQEVLKIGSSSGTDIALGLVSGLEVNIKIKNRFH